MCVSLLMLVLVLFFYFFFFNDTATTEIYTLSLHDALPICWARPGRASATWPTWAGCYSALSTCEAAGSPTGGSFFTTNRSEEHTSELQSRLHLVCRLLLEKKKENN